MAQEFPAKQENAPPSAPATEGQGGYRGKKKRGPPEDGVPSKTKVMVANLPYELSEEKVMCFISIGFHQVHILT